MRVLGFHHFQPELPDLPHFADWIQKTCGTTKRIVLSVRSLLAMTELAKRTKTDPCSSLRGSTAASHTHKLELKGNVIADILTVH